MAQSVYKVITRAAMNGRVDQNYIDALGLDDLFGVLNAIASQNGGDSEAFQNLRNDIERVLTAVDDHRRRLRQIDAGVGI